MNKGTFAHPKGRLIIAGGKVQKEVHDTEEFIPIREVLKLLYGQEIAVIIFSQDSDLRGSLMQEKSEKPILRRFKKDFLCMLKI
jgi:hypothetical protein